MKGKCISVATLLAVCLFASAASAERLNLSHPHYPLVASDFIDVTYEPTGGGGGGGILTAIGYSAELNMDEGSSETLYGDFILTVDINPATGEATGGTLEVTEDYVTGVQLFYSEQLTAFGWGTLAGDDIFECVFAQQGNMLAPDGEPVGVIMATVGAAAPWDFSNSFDNGSGNGYSKTFYLPEPSVGALLTVFGLGLLRRRCR